MSSACKRRKLGLRREGEGREATEEEAVSKRRARTLSWRRRWALDLEGSVRMKESHAEGEDRNGAKLE